jgi:hypothetical protein
MLRLLQKRGKVLAVRLGSNPNSSSLGVDVTWLLGGGALVSLLTLVGSTVTRYALGRRRNKSGKVD